MRIIVEARGRKIIDLEMMAPVRTAAPGPQIPGHDPHGTLGAQVEQASESAPGFGFKGSVSTVTARENRDR